MDKSDVFAFTAKNKGFSEAEYLQWQKLSYSVLNSARMMGLSEKESQYY